MRDALIFIMLTWLLGLTLLTRAQQSALMSQRAAIACQIGHWKTYLGDTENANYWYRECGLEP